jgi:hypothetical protein
MSREPRRVAGLTLRSGDNRGLREAGQAVLSEARKTSHFSSLTLPASLTTGQIVWQAISYGASRTRTGDLLGAIQALSQLSYSPARRTV